MNFGNGVPFVPLPGTLTVMRSRYAEAGSMDHAASGRNDAEHRPRRRNAARLSDRFDPSCTPVIVVLRRSGRRHVAGALEDGLEHRRREPAGERVLLARVVRADEGVRADPRPRRRGANRGFGRGVGWPRRGERRSAASQPMAPSATMTRRSRQQLDLAHEVRRGTSPAPRSSACSPAARSGRRRRCRRRGASGRRRRAGSPAGPRGPPRAAPRHRKSPEASPVNTRPVRLPPCAAGASPTSRIRAAGSPKPGTGRAQ